MMGKEVLFQQISDNVVEMEDELVEQLCRQSLEEGIDAAETINGGLIPGMDRVGQLYESGEYFLPEVLTASFALNAGIDVLRPHIKQEETAGRIRMVIGVVEGDTHDIGKNLVRIMAESAGFEVYDLGRDVPLEDFITTAEEKPKTVGCFSPVM